MAVYQFRGLNSASGREVRGVREADSPKGLRAVLRREGIVLTSATEARAHQASKSRDIQVLAWFKRPTVADIAITTKQLATLIRAGIPLTEAISALTDQVEKEELKRVLASVREQVNQGVSFAQALAEHPKVFPSLYINMVAAGEASGTLESVLDRLATFMDSQAKLRGKVSAALAYPFLMTIIGSILIAVLMIGVVPKVTAIFDAMGKELPWYTSLLIWTSGTLSSPVTQGLILGLLIGTGTWMLVKPPPPPIRAGVVIAHKPSSGGPIALIVAGTLGILVEAALREVVWPLIVAVLGAAPIGAAIGAGLNWLRTEQGRIAFDGSMLRMPIFGPLLSMIAVARFAKTLATLLASGVQLLRAMEIVRAVIGNAALERVVEEATVAIREGESIADPLRRSKRFPPIVTHMIAVGERSGQLEHMLETISESYESSVDLRVAALTSILEPLVIVFMGGIVGFIAFAILMPLVQMNDFNQ